MQKLQIFTVYDSASRMFLEPFVAATLEVALRMFREAVNKPGHQFNKFPGDYTLFHVGEFDQEDGMVHSAKPHNLGVAITLLESGLMLDPALKEASNG